MIYIGSLIAGFMNGFFASGAGQILVFFLIYVIKLDTHKARATSLACTSIIAIISAITYIKFLKDQLPNLALVAIVGFALGGVGSKIANKIKSNKLNLLSGLIIFGFSLFKLIFGR